MARPEIEQPVVTEEDGYGTRGETMTSHPAFAQIGVSRVSGGHTTLYDSDFQHNAYMTIRIQRSELRRSLSRDWHFAREEYIEVALTEAQWATFVSSPNVGSGVPCTLVHKNGQQTPLIPPPVARTAQFKGEMTKDLADTLESCDNLTTLIQSLGLPKGKTDKLLKATQSVRGKLTSSLPFVAEQFDEHMEQTVEAAKTEVHGYMTGAINRAGLKALSADNLPLQLENNND
jgi:hypothetical protein